MQKGGEKMKPSEIKVGKTYCNRGKGYTMRTVINISDKDRPNWWYGAGKKPDEPGVLYEQYSKGKERGFTDQLFLSSFASWAGKEVIL